VQIRVVEYQCLDHPKIHSLPIKYQNILRKVRGDLRNYLKRGDVVGCPFVEFARIPEWEFGDNFTFSSQGPLDVKRNRPFVVSEVYFNYFIAFPCCGNSERGL
jgi:hypothetical protein